MSIWNPHVARPSMSSPTGRWLQPDALWPGFILFLGLIPFTAFASFVPLYGEEVGLDSVGGVLGLYAGLVLIVRIVGARLPDRLGWRIPGPQTDRAADVAPVGRGRPRGLAAVDDRGAQIHPGARRPAGAGRAAGPRLPRRPAQRLRRPGRRGDHLRDDDRPDLAGAVRFPGRRRADGGAQGAADPARLAWRSASSSRRSC